MKCPFGRQPFYLSPWGDLFQSSKVFLHTFLRGTNQATSSGCKRFVAFGYKQAKAMLFWEHALITASLRCEERLSPIKTFLLDGTTFVASCWKTSLWMWFHQSNHFEVSCILHQEDLLEPTGHKDAQICKQLTVAKHHLQHYQ